MHCPVAFSVNVSAVEPSKRYPPGVRRSVGFKRNGISDMLSAMAMARWFRKASVGKPSKCYVSLFSGMNEIQVAPAPVLTPEVLTPASVEDGYYEILAGGARYSLFVSLLDLNILPLLSSGPLSAADIIA